MTWEEIKGNWKQFRGRIKDQWGELTNDDLDRIEGKREQLEGAIQKRYGKTKEMVKSEVEDWMKGQKVAH